MLQKPMSANSKMIERQGSGTQPAVHRYPEVRGGVCEWCGVLDPNVPSEHQYKLCPHYRGQQLECSYCDAKKNPEEVIYKSVINVYDHPYDANKLVVVCDAYECVKRHRERFIKSA
jgi:hypothetical protein